VDALGESVSAREEVLVVDWEPLLVLLTSLSESEAEHQQHVVELIDQLHTMACPLIVDNGIWASFTLLCVFHII